MTNKPKKIFISTGEASSDLYGAELATQLSKQNPLLAISGMGGAMMKKAGVNLIVDIKKLAVVGVIDVVKNLHKIFRTIKLIKYTLKQERPDLIILIDYPGVNLRLAKIAKQLGIKVLYYISPKIWATRPGRIKIIKKYVDHMAVILPFEVKLYQQANVPVTFVGHPLLNLVKPSMSKSEARKFFGFSPSDTLIGLMPGSRKSEIQYLLPIMLQTAEIIKRNFPQVQFALPLASTLQKDDLDDYLQKVTLPITIIKNNHYDAMHICDAIIVASGTATLEVTLLGVPLVIIYKTSAFNAFIARRLLKVRFLGLANLIMNREIVPELLQEAATPINIANATEKLLTDKFLQSKMIADLHLVKQKLNVPVKMDICEVAMKMLS